MPYFNLLAGRLVRANRDFGRFWAAARAALGVPIPGAPDPGISDRGGATEARERTVAYWRRYVLPWIGRRLTGRSSGDNRKPKIATLQPVVWPPRD